MKKSISFIVAGAVLGLLVGSSMGVAVGGSAYNATFFLVPLGGFVGWLIATRNSAATDPTTERDAVPTSSVVPAQVEPADSGAKGFGLVVHSALAILATVWNFHIEILNALGVLPTFVRQPLLFAGLCVVISAFFPPFLALYFFAWLGANHFGLSEEKQFRATIR